MIESTADPEMPQCLHCDQPFSAADIAAMTARKSRDDLCAIECSQCGTCNEVRSEPRAGLDAQPRLVVRRIIRTVPRKPEVFRETVEPGVDVPPEVAGSSS